MAREEWFPECGEYRGSMCEGEQVGGGTATVVGYLQGQPQGKGVDKPEPVSSKYLAQHQSNNDFFSYLEEELKGFL